MRIRIHITGFGKGIKKIYHMKGKAEFNQQISDFIVLYPDPH